MQQDRRTSRPAPVSSLLDETERRLRKEMTRVAATLYASGGMLVLISLVALGDRVDSPGGVVVVSLSSIVFGLGLFFVGERWPMPATVHVLTSASGTAVVSVLGVLGGEPTAALFGIFYVYVAAFCFYYLPMSWAVGEVTLVGVGYAIALDVINLPGAPGVWVLVMGGSITAGALIGRLGQQQRSLAASLAASDVARATMLQIVSHDLRGPLGTIIGSATTLLQRLPQLSPAAVLELVDMQQRQAQKLLDLVDDLLATERVAAGKLSLDPHQVELRLLVDNVVDTFGADSQRVSVSGGPATIEVDPTLMQRAIENLVSNALRHSEGRVQVDIDTAGAIEIHVRDQGAGIPQGLLTSVFEPFVQGSKGGGTAGLGLSLTRAIVRAHGGEVTATNRREGGAEFTITLPAAA